MGLSRITRHGYRTLQGAAVGLTAIGLFLAIGGLCHAGNPYYSYGQACARPCNPCPPGYVPTYRNGVAVPEPATPGAPTTEASPAVPAAPEEPAAGAQAPGEAPSTDLLAAAPGAGFGGGPGSAAPAMIGDFIGYGGVLHPDPWYHVPGGTSPIAGGDRRFKIAENQYVIPTDRVYFTYHHFQDALLSVDRDGNFHDVDFNRYTFGVEKTFGCEFGSVELRVPLGHGLDSDQSGVDGASLTGTEFGNVVVAGKIYLVRRCNWAITGGLGVSLPTAGDARQYDFNGDLVSEVSNDPVHLQPFLGWLFESPSGCFVQGFAACDFDTRGYDVSIADQRGSLVNVGTYNDQSLFMLDLKFGYWLYRNSCSLISGIAPTIELHYTSTMQDADHTSVLGDPLNRWDNLNLTGGMQFQVGSCSLLTVYGVAPLSDDELGRLSSNFDAEIGVQYNLYY